MSDFWRNFETVSMSVVLSGYVVLVAIATATGLSF